MSVGRETFDPATVTGVRQVLSGARRRWFLKVWLRLGALTLCLVGVGLVAAWAVWRLVEPGAGVALALGSAVLGVTIAFLVWRAGPLRRRPSDRVVARYVEERVPELDEVFISAVQCLEAPRAPSFAGLVIDDAARQVSALDLDRVVSRQELKRRALELTAAAVALIAVAVALREPLLQAIDVVRMVIAPASIAIEVAPGDVQVREGETVSIRARAVGLPQRLPREALTLTMNGARGVQDAQMAGSGEWQTFSLDKADQSFEYQVSGYGAASGRHQVEVKPIPRVARIDVHYDYPAFTGLAPHIDEDAGDVYAPAGTKVRLVVHTTVPVPNAEMTLASGKTVALAAAAAPGTLDGRLTVTADDAYRLNLLEPDGRRTPDSTEYFIRTVDDRPPEVQVLRPAGDRRVTRLEEVVIEARADDDFGVERLELAYAARGGKERVVSLGGGRGPSVTGRHTLFLEDLDVQPGDFVSYYIKARDVGRGKRPTETRSDIFFLEVRPFNEEFEAAQSNAMSGGGGGSLDDLAARQKELIVATWKLERRAGAGRSGDDIRALARAQGELKTRAESAAARMTPRAPQRRRPGQPAIPLPLAPPAADPMRNAIDAMDRSHKALEALRTGDAIPHEMEALNQLLRAEADVRRRQVTRQQSAGGRGGGSGNQDLSNLFDRELQRQQQTNYENRSSAQQGQNDEAQESEALARLRELARRQDDVGRRAQELGRRQAQLSPEEVKRQLERLTREQEELRRQAEQMAAQQREQAQRQSGPQQARGQQAQPGQQGQQGQQARAGGAGGSQSNAESLQQAAEAMQQSAGGLSREQLQQAASQAQRAAERLRQAERSMAGRQPDEASRAAGDAQLEAAQLAETERRIANELRNGQRASPDQLRQLAGQQERAAERAARLAERARDLPGRLGGEDTRSTASREARNAGQRPSGAAERGDAARALASEDIQRQLRASARNLRELAEGGGAGAAGERDERREAERAEGVARTLESAARGLGGPGGPRDARADLSEQLARAGELRDRLAELSRQVRDGAPANTRDGQQGSPDDAQAKASGRAPGAGEQGARDASRGRQAGQQAGSDQAGGRARGGRGAGEGGTGGASNASDAEAVEQELRSLQRLAESMGAEGDGLRRALQALEGYAPGRSAPGTEAWKQDFSRWEVLRKEIAATLEQFEARLSGELQAREREDRLEAGASDAAPETYRREVARYYRSIARKPTAAQPAPSKPPSRPPSPPGQPGPSPSQP